MQRKRVHEIDYFITTACNTAVKQSKKAHKLSPAVLLETVVSKRPCYYKNVFSAVKGRYFVACGNRDDRAQWSNECITHQRSDRNRNRLIDWIIYFFLFLEELKFYKVTNRRIRISCIYIFFTESRIDAYLLFLFLEELKFYKVMNQRIDWMFLYFFYLFLEELKFYKATNRCVFFCSSSSVSETKSKVPKSDHMAREADVVEKMFDKKITGIYFLLL